MIKYIMRLIALLFILSIPINVLALDAEVYLGAYTDSSFRADPDDTNTAKYISYIEVGHEIKRLRPWASVETLIDSRQSNILFHPASVKYELGATLDIYKGVYFEASHMCWHPVDKEGTVEEYNLFKIGWKYKR